MLGEPKKVELKAQKVQLPKNQPTDRFKIVKLEERIAPRGPDTGYDHGKCNGNHTHGC